MQNTYTNACGKLGAIKQIFEGNDLFKALYPEILPTSDSKWSKDAATVNRSGAYPEATWEAAGTPELFRKLLLYHSLGQETSIFRPRNLDVPCPKQVSSA